MSNESVAECLSHKDMRHVQVRLDYMQLYRNETKAKIIRILETWTNQKYADWYKSSLDSKEQKQAPPEEDLWITMSYEQFSLFAYGTIKHDTIKQSVDELVSIKHIERRVHPTIPYGPPQYLLNSKEVQKSLDEQEMPSLTDDLELITPHRKKRTPQEKYPQGRGINTPGDGVNLPPAGGENSYPSNNTTKNYRDNPKKEESTTPASLSSETDSHSHADYTKLPSRAKPIPFAEQAKAIADKRITGEHEAVKPSKQTPLPQSQVSGPPDVAPPVSGGGTAQAGAGKRTQEKKKVTQAELPKGPPSMPPEDAEWTTRTCLQLFDYWRGAPLLDIGQIKYANTCAKNLAQNYTRVQVTQVYEAMSADQWWIDHGGVDVCEVARHMHKELNKLRKPMKKPAKSANDLPEFDEAAYQRLKETPA